MPRYQQLRRWEVSAGYRAGRWEAAGADRRAALVGRTPPPRGKGGTQPGRISCVRNMGTPTESGPPWWRVGRPTVRRAEFSGGNRMSKKRMPAGESRQETSTTLNGSSRPSLLDNWLDTGPGA